MGKQNKKWRVFGSSCKIGFQFAVKICLVSIYQEEFLYLEKTHGEVCELGGRSEVKS